MTNHTPLRRASLIAVIALAGCGSGASIEVRVSSTGCHAVCTLGVMATVVAYRGQSAQSACVIASEVVLLGRQSAALEDLPFVEGESFTIGVVTACGENPRCPVCWATKAVSATAGARHDLALANAVACAPGDPILAAITKLPQKCQ